MIESRWRGVWGSRRRLTPKTTARSEGLAELLIDATRLHQAPLELPWLYDWHHWLFPNEPGLSAHPLLVATLR